MKERKKFKLGLIVLILVLAYFVIALFDIQKTIYVKQKKIDEVEKKITEQNIISKELNKLKKILNTDDYIRKIAREELGMVKPGEKVFIDPNK